MTVGGPEELLDEQDNPPHPFENIQSMTFKKLGELQQKSRRGSKYNRQKYVPKTHFNTVRVQRRDMPEWTQDRHQ